MDGGGGAAAVDPTVIGDVGSPDDRRVPAQLVTTV